MNEKKNTFEENWFWLTKVPIWAKKSNTVLRVILTLRLHCLSQMGGLLNEHSKQMRGYIMRFQCQPYHPYSNEYISLYSLIFMRCKRFCCGNSSDFPKSLWNVRGTLAPCSIESNLYTFMIHRNWVRIFISWSKHEPSTIWRLLFGMSIVHI